MSVLIKGIGMPKGNDSIALFIYPDGEVVLCGMLGPLGRYTAVPVPPHGRLIDADALDREFTALRWDDNGLAHWGDRKDWCLQGSEIEALISAAPTIIPAKEGE